MRPFYMFSSQYQLNFIEKVKFVSFSVHLNVIPNCVIFDNLFYSSVFQDTTNKHAYGRILVFINFPKTIFIGPVNKSWRFMISYTKPS